MLSQASLPHAGGNAAIKPPTIFQPSAAPPTPPAPAFVAAPAYLPPPAAAPAAARSPEGAPSAPTLGRAPRTEVHVARGGAGVDIVGVLVEAGTGATYPLRFGRNVLGREPDVGGIVLTGANVSRQHAMIFVGPDGARYVDTSSSGSRIDDRDVLPGESVALASDAVLEIGGARLVALLFSSKVLQALRS